MRLQLCIASAAALLSTPSLAFYPYERKGDREASDAKEASNAHERRFFPWLNGGLGKDTDKAPTISIKKAPSRLAKRENYFQVVLSNPSSAPNTLPVNGDGKDLSYFATVDFGSGSTPLWMLMDSGAANTWVMGTNCQSSACQIHDTFGPTDSSSLQTTNKDWTIEYGLGTVSGVVASDNVRLASFDIQLGFGLAYNTSDDFNTYPFDGILGLGRPDSSSIGTKTLIQTLNEAGLMKDNIIGVHLMRNDDGTRDGEVSFGSADSSKYKGQITYTDAVAPTGLWEIPVDGCSYNGHNPNLIGRTAVIDTGTSYIFMPPADAIALHSLFESYAPSGESFVIPCNTSGSVQFTFSGVTYNIEPEDYVGAPSQGGCLSNIIGHEAFNNSWLLGDVFLKNVYTVFDFNNQQVGFASSAEPVPAQTYSIIPPVPTDVSVKSATESYPIIYATPTGASSGNNNNEQPGSASASASGSKGGKGSGSGSPQSTATSTSGAPKISDHGVLGFDNGSASAYAGPSMTALSLFTISAFTLALPLVL